MCSLDTQTTYACKPIHRSDISLSEQIQDASIHMCKCKIYLVRVLEINSCVRCRVGVNVQPVGLDFIVLKEERIIHFVTIFISLQQGASYICSGNKG